MCWHFFAESPPATSKLYTTADISEYWWALTTKCHTATVVSAVITIPLQFLTHIPAVHFYICSPCPLSFVIFLWTQCVNIYTKVLFPEWLPAIFAKTLNQSVINAWSKGSHASDFYAHFLTICGQLQNFHFIGLLSMSVRAQSGTQWYSTRWFERQMLGESHPPCNYLHIVIPHLFP